MTESVSDPGMRLGDQRPIQAFVHDVNNPLTAALMGVALAKRRLQRGDGEAEQLLGGLSDVETQIRRVAALVATLERANRQHGVLQWPPRVIGGSHEFDDRAVHPGGAAAEACGVLASATDRRP
jgi:hypothetical protein